MSTLQPGLGVGQWMAPRPAGLANVCPCLPRLQLPATRACTRSELPSLPSALLTYFAEGQILASETHTQIMIGAGKVGTRSTAHVARKVGLRRSCLLLRVEAKGVRASR
eukprot:3819761-Prymnesium_polylepis.1